MLSFMTGRGLFSTAEANQNQLMGWYMRHHVLDAIFVRLIADNSKAKQRHQTEIILTVPRHSEGVLSFLLHHHPPARLLERYRGTCNNHYHPGYTTTRYSLVIQDDMCIVEPVYGIR